VGEAYVVRSLGSLLRMATTDPSAAGSADAANDVADLTSALKVTEDVIAGVRPEQAHLPTPCQDYDVTQLLDHLVGFANDFADKANGITPTADPTTVKAGGDPLGAYRAAAARLIEGYRDGPDSEATPIGVVLMETVTHGWDLATATDQPAPYAESAVQSAHSLGTNMLAPEYRGEGKPFGDEVTAPEPSTMLTRFIAFMGRHPNWSS
jgi:uncharacterized protein (TIGR03086 family)